MRFLIILLAITPLTLGACSTTSSGAFDPQIVDKSLDGLERAIDCPAPPASTELCWDGSQPAPIDLAAPDRSRCPVPVKIQVGAAISMSAMAQIASRLGAWALDEQAKRLAAADWRQEHCGKTAKARS